MKFYMLVLALDTTTRRGSAALLRHGTLLDCEIGDAARTHGQRLPGDIVRLLDRHGLTVRDVDLFAVAVGPGSLTGLRVGIASMQGLALANSRRIVGVSTLDALHASVEKGGRTPFWVGAWVDAQRGEVFSALYRDDELIDGPSVDTEEGLARWVRANPDGLVTFVGDGALAHANVIDGLMPSASILPTVPPLAPAVAQLAEQSAARAASPAGPASPARNDAMQPDSIRPLYVRRSDVELARERHAAEPGTHSEPSTQHPAPGTAATKT